MEITYELHAYSNDRWSIIQKYPGGEQERAIEHAKQLYREPHVSNVKVVKESYDPHTNHSTDFVVFDTSKPERPSSRRPAASSPAAGKGAAKGTAASDTPPRSAAAKGGPKTMSLTWALILLVVAIAAAAVLFVVLGVLDRSLGTL